jgi:hypothetical protein
MELLIIARDDGRYHHPDKPVGAWQVGDVVFVAPDGYAWGRRESKEVWLSTGGKEEDWPGRFIIVQAPMTPLEAESLVHSEVDDVARRRVMVDVAKLVADPKKAGRVTIDREQMLSVTVNKAPR